MRLALTLVLACACGASQEPPLASQAATLGDIRFDAPDGWTHRDHREGDRLVSRWAPSTNPDKQVISIVRTELRPDRHDADLATMEQLLVEAQRALRHGHVGAPRELETREGLRAIEIAADFIPDGKQQSYHRVHALVVTGSALIHVLYTARTDDPDLRAFQLVLDSIHREEG